MNTLFRIAMMVGGLTIISPVARAEILPSFTMAYCTWDATHIVEVTQGMTRDGTCTVFAAWKGDLKKGDVLTFPDLRDFAHEAQRRVFVFPGMKVPPERVTHVSGLRMVLFLKKDDKTATWRGVGWGRGVKTSLAWTDGGEVFAYVQIMNPGGQVVWPLELTEMQFKEKVLRITQTKEKLKQAVEMADAGQRAESLSILVGNDLFLCRREAVDALGRCGEKGLPVVRKLLKENPSPAETPDLIRAIGTIGGADAGKELVALLKDEFAFWQKRGPQLKGDWWSDYSLGQKELHLLQARNGKFNAILGALADAKYSECRPLVREVRDFLDAHPHLVTGGGYAMDKCRVILAEK